MSIAFKCARLVSRKVKLKSLTTCYFSAQNKEFVKKAKSLDRLKTSQVFSHSLYENGKYILFLKSDLVCLESGDKLIYRSFRDVQQLKQLGEVTTVFLSPLSDSESYLFAVDLDIEREVDIEKIEIDFDGKFINLRSSLYFLNGIESKFVTHARGLLNFCKHYKFCCYCGGSLTTMEGGFQKQCQNCSFIHYPTLSPIGITLVEDDKHQQVLLIRQNRHPPGMYTCVAGFIEPGESLEDNIKREVAEEVGVAVHNVEYFTSQHWALPASQIAFGCIATTNEKNFDIDIKEIAHARWVKAEELKDAVIRVREIKNLSDINEKKLWVPPRNALSHNLMVTWLNKYHNFHVTSES